MAIFTWDHAQGAVGRVIAGLIQSPIASVGASVEVMEVVED